jgi:hypothetical protein
MDLKEDYRLNKKLWYAVMRNKMKPESELSHIQVKNWKLARTIDAYLKAKWKYCKDLL